MVTFRSGGEFMEPSDRRLTMIDLDGPICECERRSEVDDGSTTANLITPQERIS